MFDLHIHAQEDNWRLFNIRAKDPRFAKIKQSIFARDKHKCQFCGFTAKSHMEVVNLDHNYGNNKTTNLVTACPLCYHSLFLEMTGKTSFGGGLMIYLPEISQNDLIGLTHIAFCAKQTTETYQSISDNIFSTLKLRAKYVEKNIGKGFSKPDLLGKLMIDTPVKDQKKLKSALKKSIRFLPDPLLYKDQIVAWSEETEIED